LEVEESKFPVTVLFGDDYQHPAFGDSGATIKNLKLMNNMTQCQGGLQFLNLSEELLEWYQVIRQSEDQIFFKLILEQLRLGWITKQD
jgi:hypothetical protein